VHACPHVVSDAGYDIDTECFGKLGLQNFEDPLTASGLLPSQAVNAIFGNVREIIGINCELMKHLLTKNIGEAFLLLGPFLKLYSTYANNHEHALASLMVCAAALVFFLLYIRIHDPT